MMKNFVFILIILFYFVAVPKAFGAATISFESPPEINIGEKLDVIVKTNTEGVTINAVEFVIGYDENILTFTGYSDDKALVKLWVDPPHKVSSSNGIGEISMTGIIPGGVSGVHDPNKKELSDTPLAHLVFRANKTGSAKFYFIKTEILKNDGEGAALIHEQSETNVLIKDALDKIKDDTKESTTSAKQNTKEDALREKDLYSSIYSSETNLTFYIVLLLLFSCIVFYKLLKYKR